MVIGACSEDLEILIGNGEFVDDLAMIKARGKMMDQILRHLLPSGIRL